MRNFSLVKACISTATSSSSTIFHTSHSFYHILHGNYATEVAVFIYNERDVLLLFQHIGSNIARQSRYELIHTTLVKFLKTCTLSDLTPEKEELAKEYLKEDSLQDSLPL